LLVVVVVAAVAAEAVVAVVKYCKSSDTRIGAASKTETKER
jgi:hypothetical protein